MKTKFLLLLPSVMVFPLLAQAQSEPSTKVTVTESTTSHTPIRRFERFQTSFGVEIKNPPKSHDEIEITGPCYKWTGGDSIVKIKNPDNESSVTLDTGSRPDYQGAEGNYAFSVTCTVTYNQSNKSNPNQQLPALTFSDDTQCNFFIRVPRAVVTTAPPTPTMFEDLHNGQTVTWTELGIGPWYAKRLSENRGAVSGNRLEWKMRVLDNRSPMMPYSEGTVREDFKNFSPSTFHPNQGVESEFSPSTGGSNEGGFIDKTGWTIIHAPDSIPSEPLSDTLIGTVSQDWFFQDWEEYGTPYWKYLNSHTLTYNLYSVVRSPDPSNP